jgi:hypothetical protein
MHENRKLLERLDAMRREWELFAMLPPAKTKAKMREQYWMVRRMRVKFESDPDVAAILASKPRRGRL